MSSIGRCATLGYTAVVKDDKETKNACNLICKLKIANDKQYKSLFSNYNICEDLRAQLSIQSANSLEYLDIWKPFIRLL